MKKNFKIGLLGFATATIAFASLAFTTKQNTNNNQKK